MRAARAGDRRLYAGSGGPWTVRIAWRSVEVARRTTMSTTSSDSGVSDPVASASTAAERLRHERSLARIRRVDARRRPDADGRDPEQKIPEAGHTGGFDARPHEYAARVLAFFDRALLAGPGSIRRPR